MALHKRLAFAFGVIFVCVLLFIAIRVPEPTEFQLFVFRVVLGLAASGIGAIIPGFINMAIRKEIRIAGALALFVLVYLYNPAQLITRPPKEKKHSGYVSVLQAHLNKSTTEGFSLTLAGARQNQLREFWIADVAGKSWAELFRKICDTYASCLQCIPSSNQIDKAVTFELVGDVVEARSPEGARIYSCK